MAETTIINNQSKSKTKAEDKKSCCSLLYVMFLLFGVGSLLPFNCYITPYEYIVTFYPRPTLSFFSLFYNVGNWSMMFIYLKFGRKIPARSANLVVFITWIVCLTILPTLVFFNMDKIPRFVIALILVFVSGALNGICFPKIISVGSRIDFSMVQAMMSGNGVAGIITAALYAITKGVAIASGDGKFTEGQLKYGTLSYFILSDLFLIACVFAWIKVMKDYPHLNYDEQQPEAEIKIEESISADIQQQSGALANDTIEAGAKPMDSATNPKTGQRYTFMQLVRILLMPGFGVFFVFLVTLAFFPAISGQVPYVDGHYGKKDDHGWWSVSMTSLFMIFDYVGRTLPQIEALTRVKRVPLLIMSLARIVFGVMFMLMALPIPTRGQDGKITAINSLIQSDYVSTINMILFALTNGYVSTVGMIRYGDDVPHPSYMATSGNIMSFWLNTGLITGGLISLCIDVGLNPGALSFNENIK